MAETIGLKLDDGRTLHLHPYRNSYPPQQSGWRCSYGNYEYFLAKVEKTHSTVWVTHSRRINSGEPWSRGVVCPTRKSALEVLKGVIAVEVSVERIT